MPRRPRIKVKKFLLIGTTDEKRTRDIKKSGVLVKHMFFPSGTETVRYETLGVS